MISTPTDAPAPVRIAPPMTFVGFVLLTAAFLLGSQTLATSDRPTSAVVWGGLALATFAGGLLCWVGQTQHAGLGLTRWKIGPWILAWYGVCFGLATVTWSQPATSEVTAEIALPNVLRALWLVGVALALWAAGYCIAPGRWVHVLAARVTRAMHRRITTDIRGLAAPWILYAVGIAARFADILATGRFGYFGDVGSAVSAPHLYSGFLGALSLCAPLAVAAAALQVFRQRLTAARITLAVLFLSEVSFGAAAGGKESFVVTILAVIIPFSAARRRLPKAVLIALMLVFLVVVIPFNQAYRSVARSGAGELSPSQAVAEAPAILNQTVTGNGVVTVVPDSVDYLAQRIREIDNPAIILQRTPGQIPFLSPVQLIETPIAGMVPRAIWPSKPSRMTGLQFSEEFFEVPPNTSSADTLVGGLYRYGGWGPVIVGMFLFGCAVRLLDDVLDVRADPHAVFLVLLLFPSLVGGEQDWEAIVAAIPATVCVWLLSVVITFRARRRT